MSQASLFAYLGRIIVRDHPRYMLRSMVGAVAANMMLVQCNSDVPVSLACFVSGAKVQTTASSEPLPLVDLECRP